MYVFFAREGALGSPEGGSCAKKGDELDNELSVGDSNGGGLITRFAPGS